MKEVILIRHGEVEGFTEDIMYGWTDLPLSLQGHEQTLACGRRLSREKFDYIACSPLLRARQSLENILSMNKQAKQPEPVFDARLREIGLGAVEMGSKATLPEKHPALFEAMQTDWKKIAYPGGESMLEFQARAKSFVEEEIHQNEHEKILIVAHSGLNRMLMMELLQFNSDFYLQMILDFAGIVRMLVSDDGYATLLSLNGR